MKLEIQYVQVLGPLNIYYSVNSGYNVILSVLLHLYQNSSGVRAYISIQ